MKQRNLTEKDKKEIRYAIRVGYIIPGMIILFSLIVNLYFHVVPEVSEYLNTIYLIDIGVISFCILISYLMNNKHYKDLRDGTKSIKQAKVYKKMQKRSAEAGSGSLYIPILGALFPKHFSEQPTVRQLKYFIIGSFRYKVDEQLFKSTKEGDEVDMHYSKKGKVLLSIQAKQS